MDALLFSVFRAVRSLFAPGMLRVFVVTVLVTLLGLFVFAEGVSIAAVALSERVHNTTLAEFLPWIGIIGGHVLAWFLFPGIMPVIISFFDARIARLIERHDYPANSAAQELPFWPELWHDVRFSLLAVLLNLLVLPLYLVPVLNLFLFYLLNGYLLGREFFVMTAKRHRGLIEAEALRRRHGGVIMAAGMMLALLATIPVVNLFAPFWGIAVMVHLYHELTHTPDSELLLPR